MGGSILPSSGKSAIYFGCRIIQRLVCYQKNVRLHYYSKGGMKKIYSARILFEKILILSKEYFK